MKANDIANIQYKIPFSNLENTFNVHQELDEEEKYFYNILKTVNIPEDLDPESELNHIDVEQVLAHHVEDMIVRPDSVDSLAESFNQYRVEEIAVLNHELHGKLVREIAFPPQGSLVIQRRGSEIFIPHGNTHLLEGDVITVIGNANALIQFRKTLSGV